MHYKISAKGALQKDWNLSYKKGLGIFCLLVQVYFIISSVYSINYGQGFIEQQAIFYSFWSIFPGSYQVMLFVFAVSALLLGLTIHSLSRMESSNLKIFLVMECLFSACILWGLL